MTARYDTTKSYCAGLLLIALSFDISAQGVHYASGLSIRNRKQSHYYKMVDWDDSPYEEFAYWEESQFGTVMDFMNWRAAFPAGYNKDDKNTRYPAIVMLHGSGESGRKWTDHFEYTPSDPEYDNNGHHLLYGGSEHLRAIERSPSNSQAFPGIVIFPQVSYNGAWDTNNRRMLIRIIEYMIREYNVDPYRIAIHGLSNGAKGAWAVATERPDLFAAILVMSGIGTDLEAMTDTLVTTPLWVFQGGLDTNPSPGASMEWVDKLTEKGGTPRYTLYDSAGHGTWNKAYAEPDFFSWILDHDKRNIHVLNGMPESPCDNTADKPLKLGFSAGYSGYQWTRDGEDIPDATGRYYTATENGTYTVRFKKKTDSLWAESHPLEIFYSDPNFPKFVPSLRASGSTALPLNGPESLDKTLDLTASPGFAHYEWYKDGALIQNSEDSILNLNDPSGTKFASSDAGSYTVLATDPNGCSTLASDPVTVTYNASQSSFSPPAGITKSAVSSTGIEISWTDTDYETSYELWRARRNTLKTEEKKLSGYPGTSYRFVSSIPAGHTTFTDQGLRPGAEYDYIIRALHPDGSTFSENEPEFVATPHDTSHPTTPAGLRVEDVTETEIHLSWSPSDDDDVVYRYEIFNNEEKIADVRSDTTDQDLTDGSPAPPVRHTLTGLTPGAVYHLRVRAADYEGNNFEGNYSPLSTHIIVQTEIVLNAGGKAEKLKPNVYPNPFRDKIRVKLPQGMTPPIMTLYDLAGKEISGMTFQGNEMLIDLSGLQKGTYIMSIGQFSLKIVKR